MKELDRSHDHRGPGAEKRKVITHSRKPDVVELALRIVRLDEGVDHRPANGRTDPDRLGYGQGFGEPLPAPAPLAHEWEPGRCPVTGEARRPPAAFSLVWNQGINDDIILAGPAADVLDAPHLSLSIMINNANQPFTSRFLQESEDRAVPERLEPGAHNPLL